MVPITSKIEQIGAALTTAHATYGKSNPKSSQTHKESIVTLPGGTTRNVVHFEPFPVTLTSGQGSYLKDLDGHRYLDLCGEYSAGMFGHSHPVITKAMHAAIDSGFALGGVNQFEGRLAQLLCSRFSSIDKIRFSNSGTEANLTALALVKAYTKRETVIVFKGGYHGGLATFGKDGKVTANSMNVPHKFIIAPYNDIKALEEIVEEHKDDLACIFLELMQGSSGCLPADIEFVKATRAKANEAGAVLMFDEVMTSRMSTGGLQSLLGVYPDMTTLGKYFGGGGQNFGAFGGRNEIMSIIEPGHPGGAYHSGTYNNNVTTMAAGVAVLQDVWTKDVASQLYETGEWLQNELRRVTGVGSLMTLHFSTQAIRSAADVQGSVAELRELFLFDMLRRGFFLAQRGMISLMTVTSKAELQTFVEAVQKFLEERRDLIT
ncbi:Beta-phenylalanine transaminase [Lachnellula hyalina]|uniref:Beta-phenylalanine transaminase n=1 Tax=Lachnellula hyalina TaxID=1316788 RepID=A0A8H8QV70_9HELO|nr:Beta-phenylalanine transaminase [Lachnellula hyalina]TVY22686.1 Beta-phenylalanine transaminase [Lachnellula hyalina]